MPFECAIYVFLLKKFYTIRLRSARSEVYTQSSCFYSPYQGRGISCNVCLMTLPKQRVPKCTKRKRDSDLSYLPSNQHTLKYLSLRNNQILVNFFFEQFSNNVLILQRIDSNSSSSKCIVHFYMREYQAYVIKPPVP